MPLPRRKDDGTGAAPVLDIMKARVKLLNVEEHVEPFTVTRKSDGAAFTLDPQFKCTVEVIDDFDDGAGNGAKFFESFKYKEDKDEHGNKTGKWINQDNSKLGMLTQAIKPGYFDDESIPALTAEDLEGFEMHCRVKPKKNPNTGKIIGSTIDWETMKPLRAQKVAATVDEEPEIDESDFEDLPF
jgi:hypothetical protein